MRRASRLSSCPASRLAGELAVLGVGLSLDDRLADLTDTERASVADYIAFLASRHSRRARPRG
jgi:hypothetical protein